jgi:uncharacterized protein YjbI with pentapeptide repeats
LGQCAYWSQYDRFYEHGKKGDYFQCELDKEQDDTFCYFHKQGPKDPKEFSVRFEDYIETRIKNNLEVFCIGFIIPDFSFYGNGQPVNSHTWIFEKDVFFQECNFLGKFYLQEVKFNNNAYFDNAVFRKDLELNYCEFRGNVSLEKVMFRKEFFLKVALLKQVIFHNCEFFGMTKFQVNSNIAMYEELQFWDCNFHSTVSFYGSQFKGKNLFLACTFKGKVDFNQAYLYNQTRYTDKTIINFENCVFDEEVEFIESRFPSHLEKIVAIHKPPKGFLKPNFLLDKDRVRMFFNNHFQANYREGHKTILTPWKLQACSSIIKFNLFDRLKYKVLGINRFRKKFLVKGTKYSSTFILRNEIDTDITFNDQKFNAKIFYVEKDYDDYLEIPIKFNYSTFRKRVRFVGTVEKPLSLSAVSFKGVDLSNFEFHNVEWIRRRQLMKHRYILIDELFLKKLGNHEEVSNIYNQLRKNYETKLLFNESSDFFIGEMECIRKSLWKKNNSIYRLSFLPYLLYKVFALYGESIKLPLLWSGGIIVFIALLDYWVYDRPNILEALTLSAKNFLPISWIIQGNSNTDLFYIEKLLSLIVFGSLFIALRRRFERKK